MPGKKKKNEINSLADIPEENINPTDFETTFGVLVPWGGAYVEGGAGIRYDDNGEPYVMGDEDGQGDN